MSAKPVTVTIHRTHLDGRTTVTEYPLPDTLTFAAAMALDPSEVECCLHPEGGDSPWLALDKHKYLTLYQLRMRYFRRARPKRSRVQEMAESGQCGRSNTDVMSAAIRAVCEYLRDDSENRASHHRDVTADEIERVFLEPR